MEMSTSRSTSNSVEIDIEPVYPLGYEECESENEDMAATGEVNASSDDSDSFRKPKRNKISEESDDFLAHLKSYSQRLKKKDVPQQQKIDFPSTRSSTRHSYLHSGKFDMAAMRESAAEWVLMHEHPFSIVEEEGFNLMQERGMPEWQRIDRTGNKNDCTTVYEREKSKLKIMLATVEKISLTTDLWKSKNQKIEYMVITGHWIDNSWKLQKRVLNFVHIPPPRRGVQIADSIFKCVKDWGIESKVYTISVDNASINDTALGALKDTFSGNKSVLAKGRLFHARCCAHMLNLMVQDGLSEIKDTVGMIRDSVDFINKTDGRRLLFAEIVQQLQLPGNVLISDCKTRWDSTFEMLTCALKFQDVFPRFQDRESSYDLCPTVADWKKVEKVCNILQLFWTAAHVMCGSDNPTSNLYLTEVCRIKVLLDTKVNDEDDFVKSMVQKMKATFDKYWGECNLLMAIAAILDPRCKMRVIDYCFPLIYPPHEVLFNKSIVRRALYDLYDEYVEMYASNSSGSRLENIDTEIKETSGFGSSSSVSQLTGLSEFLTHISTTESVQPRNTELDAYFEDGLLTSTEDSSVDIECLDALKWWRDTTKYKILPKMAADILAIPMSTVASEAAFSAGTRIIDSYRASLAPENVEMLVCGGDWCRKLHGVKKATKVNLKSLDFANGHL